VELENQGVMKNGSSVFDSAHGAQPSAETRIQNLAFYEHSNPSTERMQAGRKQGKLPGKDNSWSADEP
jgi:hypothetical protein